LDRKTAQDSVDRHEAGLEGLKQLDIPAILSSRPVWANDRLANEAFVLEQGAIRPVHQKHYFPQEIGWYESTWYRNARGGFQSADINGLRAGVMLCTDAMFNEHARHYGRQGASLIAIPRAAGVSIENWLAAGKMAAIVSGAYVVSSNRAGRSDEGVTFGGAGFAYGPDGSLLAVTSAAEPLLVIDVDPDRSARQRRCYPCYVVEPDVRGGSGAA
jgi:N-carbamoylputrescine amidase